MKDPIVEEVRAARQNHAKRFNFDLAAICKDLKKIEKNFGTSYSLACSKILKASSH